MTVGGLSQVGFVNGTSVVSRSGMIVFSTPHSRGTLHSSGSLHS